MRRLTPSQMMELRGKWKPQFTSGLPGSSCTLGACRLGRQHCGAALRLIASAVIAQLTGGQRVGNRINGPSRRNIVFVLSFHG